MPEETGRALTSFLTCSEREIRSNGWRSNDMRDRLRRTPSKRDGPQRQARHREARDHRDVLPDLAGVAAVDQCLHGVHGVGEREYVADLAQPVGQDQPRDEESAQQDLGDHDRRHELHRLELRLSEGAHEQPERTPQDGVGHRHDGQQPDRPVDLEAENPDGEGDREDRLKGGQQSEGERVAEQEVALAHRHREQAFEGAAGALAQRGHAGHQEHDDEREHRQQTRPELVERLPGHVVEHPPQQRDQDAREQHQHRESTAVSAELGEDPGRDGEGDPGVHASTPLLSTSWRKASSTSSTPAFSLMSVGVPSAMIRPSRISSSRSQRSASSMTWLETSTAAPASAISWNSRHRSLRSTGSRPTVGSSSTSTSGSLRSATARLARDRWPPLRLPTTWSRWLVRSTL